MTTRLERLSRYRETRRRFRPDRHQFEQLVQEALESIPEEFRAHLRNVAVVVQEQAAPRGESDEVLLGLYQGAGNPAVTEDAHLVVPDRITLYRQPILAAGNTRAEVIREIRTTLIHEIGHHFGLAERELP